MAAELRAHSRQAASEDARRAKADASARGLSDETARLHADLKVIAAELATVKGKRDRLVKENKALQVVEEKNRSLSLEVDRLTVAAAAATNGVGGQVVGARGLPDGSQFEKRLTEVRQEKDALQKKLKAHEAHSTKVRETYQKLSQMYNDLREHNAALQSEVDQIKANKDEQNESDAGERDDLLSELDEARRDIDDLEADKEALQSDHDRLESQVNSLQERLRNTTGHLEDSQAEVDALYEESVELKAQRDMAMQRALSRGKSMAAGEQAASRSVDKVEEELRVSREKSDREQTRLMRRVAELEQEVADLREDIEYEKAEKIKTRAERDNFRNNARTLERKTSVAAKQSDAMSSLKRQISTHQMRQQDHESMITELKSEVGRLEAELTDVKGAFNDRRSSNAEELGDVLQDLVMTKLALAQAEDDKLNLQFSIKERKKSEKVTQQRLAEHASRLEVELGEANEELEKLRRQQQLEDATELNEVGSDVDY
ncbi:unnamed protein product [Chondrus crispus]|uniref:Uncharacterized protein n=1 Tax=Chondrus crispus TaxID=2769 RepID=R7QVB4_CHOCR|nr:unnamed protein product [Chondrus crispus]CDF41290.1 unnamed protein product [Chondrus crispus]|eukprot:XP_005711584.1 unnamed protein product [Chondrus crispus]